MESLDRGAPSTTTKRLKVNIAIISNNRLLPLKRLCESLLAARVHENLAMSLSFNLEASSSPDLVSFVEAVQWPHGPKSVRRRILQGGLVRAVSEAWYPSSPDEFGLFLEDDIEVSPYFTDWLMYAMEAYRADRDPRLVGISLYTPRVTETYLVDGRKPRFDGNRISSELFEGYPFAPLLMQTPCSWGALYFPQHWPAFLSYLRARMLEDKTHFVIEGSRTNGWAESWKKFKFEYMWAKGLYLLYPNFKDQRSFSTNHLEGGVHVGQGASKAFRNNIKDDFAVPLFGSSSSREEDAATWESFVSQRRRLADLPTLDLFNRRLSSEGTLREQLRDTDRRWRATTRPSKVQSQEVVDFLGEGQTLWTTPTVKMRLRTQTGMASTDIIYQGMLRKDDGSFAIFAKRVKNDMDKRLGKLIALQTNEAFKRLANKSSSSFSYSLTLTARGNLVLYAHPHTGRQCDERRCDDLHDEKYCTSDTQKLCRGFGANKTCAASNRCQSGHKSTKFLVWNAGTRSAVLDSGKSYQAEISGGGALAVHAGSRGACVKDVIYRTDGKQTKEKQGVTCRERARWPDLRELRCEKFHSRKLHARLADSASVTVLISTYDRFQILMKQISYYATSPRVSCILVTWHNMHLHPPNSTKIGHVFVHFLPQKEDSLSNRFNPSWQIATDAALIIDDDMKVHVQDIDVLFEAWKKSPSSIVGFAPRWIGSNSQGNLKYIQASEDPPVQSPDDSPRKGYSLMLTKVMMVHRDLLYQYSCGGNELRHTVHRMVDLYRNCEDIGFNALTALSKKKNKAIGSGPVLFVKPLHQLGDFGKSGTALHSRSKHQQVRSNCLNQFDESFRAVTGGAAASAFPVQDTVVETRLLEEDGGGAAATGAAQGKAVFRSQMSFNYANPIIAAAAANPAPPGAARKIRKRTVELRPAPYAGHRTRLHVDCIVDPSTGDTLRAVDRDGDVTPLPEACKWTKPEPGFLESHSFVWAPRR